MDEREWKTFTTVVEEGNITKAAGKLFISQPALSYRLRHMERELDISLLLRTNEGIILTPEGEVFYEYCRHMLGEQESLRQKLSSVSGKISGTLKISSSINFADYELPHLLRLFREQYPDITVHVKTGFSHQAIKSFNSGECMIAFARGDYNGVGQATTLLEEPYCVVYKDPVPFHELGDIPFIRYQTDPTVANVIETWCGEHIPQMLTLGMEVNSMVTCRHFVREGLGWSILTYMGLGSCKDRDIVVRPVCDKQGNFVTRTTKMFYNESILNLSAAKIFIEFVTAYYKEHEVVDTSFFYKE